MELSKKEKLKLLAESAGSVKLNHEIDSVEIIRELRGKQKLGGNQMKSTGIIRKVDELGRIVLPKELRTILAIEERDAMEIFMDGEQIVLQKYKPNKEKENVLEELTDMLISLDDVAKKDVLERAIKLIK